MNTELKKGRKEIASACLSVSGLELSLACLVCRKLWIPFPARHASVVVVQACSSNIWSWMHENRKSKVTLGYIGSMKLTLGYVRSEGDLGGVGWAGSLSTQYSVHHGQMD